MKWPNCSGTNAAIRHVEAALDFVGNLDHLTTPDQVMNFLVQTFSAFGLGSIVVAGLDPARRFDESTLANRWPTEFFQEYTQRHYIRFDPIARIARDSMTPFFWDEATWARKTDSLAHEVMNYAGEFGIRQGCNIPVRGPKGLEAVVSLAGDRIEIAPESAPALHLMGFYAFERLRCLIGVRSFRSRDLTEREREVLAWSAQGMSAWEIGSLLDISKRTVDEHIGHACRKLKAHNRTHAVAIALRDRLIEL